MSQDALARRAALTRVYVTRLEAGRQDPSLSTINALARALGVPVTALLE
jgi:transcriptional regulator with XRE-family HTH domain